MSTPRTFFDIPSLKIDNNGIECVIIQIIDNKEVLYKLKKIKILNDIDHTLLKFDHKYPYDKLHFEFPLGFLEEYYKEHKQYLRISEKDFFNCFNMPLDSQILLNDHFKQMSLSIELEVLYVGKSYGKNGNRLAQDRLSAHSTLQRILTDYYSNHQDKRIFILLLEMTPLLNSSMDGISNQFEKSEEEDEEHVNKVLNNIPIYEQVINITEAAIINFFKPHYNEKFIDNFPLSSHKSYQQYYDLDYNALRVEIDMEFEHSPQMILITKNNKITCVWDFIEYNLFNDSKRKSMYEIFD